MGVVISSVDRLYVSVAEANEFRRMLVSHLAPGPQPQGLGPGAMPEVLIPRTTERSAPGRQDVVHSPSPGKRTFSLAGQ